MTKYKKFEEWMVGKTVRDGDGDRGVVTQKYNDSDRRVWVEWEGIGEAWTYIDYLVFLDEATNKEVTMKDMERLALHRVLKFLPRRFIKENQDRLKKLGDILYENVDSVELSPEDIVEYLCKKYGVN